MSSQQISSVAERVVPGIAQMMLQRQRWVHRRVEAVTLLDEARILRRISIDFTVPDYAGIGQGLGGVSYLPLTLLNKRVLTRFDLRAEDGRALSMLTAAQHGQIAGRMAIGSAKRALLEAHTAGAIKKGQARLDRSLQRGIYKLVTGPAPEEGSTSLALLDQHPVHLKGAQFATKLEVLRQDRDARALLEDLERLFMVLVPLRVEAGERRIVKLAYEEALPPTATDADSGIKLHKRLGKGLALEPWSFAIDVSAGGQAASYHAELEAPEDLVIAQARLEGRSDGTWKPFGNDARGTDRAHLLPSTSVPRSADVRIYAKLALRPTGLLPTALLISLATTGMLCVGLGLHCLGVGVHADAAGAVVVVVPAIYAPFLALATAHRLARKVVWLLRTLLVAVTAIAFAAAGSLVAALEGGARTWTWGVLAVASVVPTAAFAFSWNNARAK
jgi:hypothetical protein